MKLACVLLAAGASTRFGGCKQLALLNGKALLSRALDTLAPLFTEHLHVVLGANREQIQAVIGSEVSIVEHDDWAAGIGSSIARGVSFATGREQYDGVLVALADQPLITRADYQQMVSKFDGERIVASQYDHQLGAPTLFPATLFAELTRLEGDSGAKRLLSLHSSSVLALSLPHAATDIDRLADLVEIQQRCAASG